LGNFLVVTSTPPLRPKANQLYQFGSAAAQLLKSQQATKTIHLSWVQAVTFTRLGGLGTPLVQQPESENWLLASGAWFHQSGFGTGQEIQLLSRYDQVGAERLADELEGFYTIVIGNGRTKQLFVLTDITGSCHSFVRRWKDLIAISGSSLLLASLDRFELDLVGCQEFLFTGVIYENRTFYREVKKVGPGALLTIANGSPQSEKRYWKVESLQPESISGKNAVRTMAEKLTQAAGNIGRAFSNPVCDLTGGYDSRAVVAAFLTAGVRIETTVSGLPNSSDVVISSGLAKKLGLSHFHQVVPEERPLHLVKQSFKLTDGEYDLLDYSRILLVHENLSRRYDISVNGSYGELARGYWWELLFPRTGKRKALDAGKLSRKRYAALPYDASLVPPEIRLDLVSHLADVIQSVNSGLLNAPNTMQMDNAYLMLRMQRWQGKIASSTNQLWPCVSLFHFRSVLEILLQASVTLRRRSLLIRKFLAEVQPVLADYPLEHGYPPTPLDWKNFYRFAPLASYYSKRICSKLRRQLPGRRMTRTGTPSQSPRIRLWDTPELQVTLLTAEERLASLIDPKSLSLFLQQSKLPTFPWEEQWCRLLSLSYALMELDRVQKHNHAA
jgi:hypothetical protein